jgi:hypothetical protein
MAVLLEMRDTSFHNDKELNRAFSPPFVIAVPLLPTPAENRHARWIAMGRWMAGSALTLMLLAAEFYVYKRG